MLIVLYVSGHGFGHASRDIELIRALRARRPDTRVIVRTSVPRWLFAPVADAAVAVGPRVGVAYAGEAAGWPLRFALRGNREVSRPRLP
jgi:3-methyladenine DNA glycosylase Mpg